MVQEIVKKWIDELLKKHEISNLKNLSTTVVLEEISEAKCNIENCKIWGDELGIACNNYYIDCLTKRSI